MNKVKKISDDVVVSAKITDSSGCVVNIKSSVLYMFESHIREAVLSVLREFEIKNINIDVDDYGALDFVIRARTRMAIRRAMKGDVV